MSTYAKRALIVLAVIVGMNLAVTSPARADSTTCWVGLHGCTTNVIYANSNHWVDWYVDSGATGAGCSWQVIDANSYIIVGSGRVGAFYYNGNRIYGLYGLYYMELYDCGWTGYGQLDNV